MVTHKTVFTGLDILKFLLALFIVSIHTELFNGISPAEQLVLPLKRCGVPTFLAISSFLFFYRNDEDGRDGNRSIWKYIKRILLLYIVWEIVMFPLTYFSFYKTASFGEVLNAIFLGSTFQGSWFLKSLLLGMVVLYFLPKRYLKVFTLLTSAVFVFLVWKHDYFVTNYHFVFYFFFVFHLGALSAGALMASYKSVPVFNLSPSTYLVLLCTAYLLSLLPHMEPFFRLACPYILIPLFLQVHSRHPSFCKLLRNASILVFFIHFGWIGIVHRFFPVQHDTLASSFGYYLLILTLSLATAGVILLLEKRISVLRYLH